MTRIISYNILLGGVHRVDQLAKILEAQQPDIVGLVEATDQQVVQALADRLGMHYTLSGQAHDPEGSQSAILSHLPIINAQIHANDILTKQPLLEVSLQETNLHQLTIFVTHLTANFSKGRIANRSRRNEIQALLQIMSLKKGNSHLLIGDFNSLAPGEHLKASRLLWYMTNPDLYYRLRPDPLIKPPDLDFVLPAYMRFMKPLLAFIPQSKTLSALLDTTDCFYAPRGGIDLLQKRGYRDCFRSINRSSPGFTWPSSIPSGRIDFIFASPELASRLIASDVIDSGNDIRAEDASDHLPIFADFAGSTKGLN